MSSITLTRRLAPLCALVLLTSVEAQAQLVIGHLDTDLDRIPAQAIDQAQARLHIAYNHTSHGSQLITGLDALAGFPPYAGGYLWSTDGSAGLDLDDNGIPCDVSDLSQGDWIDGNGVTPWVTCTRNFLKDPANAHVNVVIWSWCSIDGHDAQRYLDNMEMLIAEYPNVQFVFMTGHAEGQGEDMTTDSVHYNNERIRQHCAANHRILFDFADIEAYDPEGRYYGDLHLFDNLDYDGGNWAAEWIAAHPSHELTALTTGAGVPGYDGCYDCAHSDVPQAANINCVLKGRAAWWMFARLAGWSGRQDVCDGEEICGGMDHLLDYQIHAGEHLLCSATHSIRMDTGFLVEPEAIFCARLLK